jgi:pimeloyl-ACP methyl ester carboxylesterase
VIQSVHWREVAWAPHVHDAEVLGRRLRYVDYGDGPALLLVHGLGGSWQTWLENIPELGRSHRVLAVDLPGFGGSDVLPPGAPLDAHVDVLVGLLDALGISEAAVCGHSLGGLVAGRFALLWPDRVRALVLVCAGGIAISPRRLNAIVRSFTAFNAVFARPPVTRAVARRARLRRALLSRFTRDPSSLSPQLAAEIVPLMAAPGFADAVAAGARAAADPGVEEVAAPTLLLWGRHDRILPVAGAHELARRMLDARVVVLDEAGHCPMFECPGEFNTAVLDFLAGAHGDTDR